MSVVASTRLTTRTHRTDDDVQAVVQELNELQQVQQAYLAKISQEQEKQDALAMSIVDTDQVLQKLRRQIADLRNDDPNRVARKAIQRKEKQIELARTALGTTGTELAQLRMRIDTLRREKLQLYSACGKLEKSIQQKEARQEQIQNDIKKTNEQKAKIKTELASVRQQVIGDMESFANELDRLKIKIAKDKLAVASKASPPVSRSATRPGRAHTLRSDADLAPDASAVQEAPLKMPTMQDLQDILTQTGLSSFQELREMVHQYEEEEFHLYHTILGLNESLDRLRTDNALRSSSLKTESEALADEDGAADAKRRALDAELLGLRLGTERYETSQQAYLELIKSVAEPLMQVVKTVCPDDSTIEDSSIHSGINDRNVDAALSILEGRVDELIQLSRAAAGEDVGLDDLCKPPEPEVDAFGRVPALRPPVLQETFADSDDDDEEDDESLHPVDIAQLQQGIAKRSRPATKTTQHRPRIAAPMMRRGTVGAM